MDLLKLFPENASECAKRAADVLRAGGVIIYPTDTLYGLGADAFSDEAVEKVYRIKVRDESKPVHCVVADIEMASQYGELNETACALAEKFLPGPLTLVVEKKPKADKGIGRGIGTIGFRIPKHDFCMALAREFGKPYTTTSANISTMDTGASIGSILEQFGDAANSVDLIIDGGELPMHEPSTVVGVHGTDIVILRDGAISASSILEAASYVH